MTSISELQETAYQQAVDKGFHDDDTIIVEFLRESGHDEWADKVQQWQDGNKIALMHSELSEALEELRSGRAVNETYYPISPIPFELPPGVGSYDEAAKLHIEKQVGNRKPEGVPSEIADNVIRALDFCGARGIDLESMITEKLAYNATRSHRHGGKKF